MRIRYRKKALADLAEIRAFIASSNPHAAKRVMAAIQSRIRTLLPFPDNCRAGPVDGTRELVVMRYGYIVTLRVEANEVVILSIFHAAQNKPRGG